jgi:hypothetical protein
MSYKEFKPTLFKEKLFSLIDKQTNKLRTQTEISLPNKRFKDFIAG